MTYAREQLDRWRTAGEASPLRDAFERRMEDNRRAAAERPAREAAS